VFAEGNRRQSNARLELRMARLTGMLVAIVTVSIPACTPDGQQGQHVLDRGLGYGTAYRAKFDTAYPPLSQRVREASVSGARATQLALLDLVRYVAQI